MDKITNVGRKINKMKLYLFSQNPINCTKLFYVF